MPKEITTLVEDIYALFNSGHEVSQEDAEAFGKAIADVVSSRLKGYQEERAGGFIRPSNYGKPDRQLWYELKETAKETLPPYTKLKFLYGDIIELLAIFLAEQAGHTVTDKQKRAEHPSGIHGSLDCTIDGVLTDVKSVSSFSFKKFAKGELAQDDPFGYIPQLRFYMKSEAKSEGAFLYMGKENGKLGILKVSADDNAVDRRVSEALALPARETAPPRCDSPVPERVTGNMYLPVKCAYCPFKHTCHTKLRTYLTKSGIPRHYTFIKKIPEGYIEITHNSSEEDSE